MSAAAMPPAVVAAATAATRGVLRLEDGGAEEALLARLATSALLLGEAFTGALLIAREVAEAVPADGSWRMLSAAPVRAIALPDGMPADGFAMDIDADGRGWVRMTTPGAPVVHYTAGLADEWDGLPAPIAQGVAALAAHLFEARGGDAQPPAAVAALWRPYRRMRLAEAGR